MLEYVGDGLYLERSCGEFDPVTVEAIDDLIRICERQGLRLLLTPFDTFFTWVKWDDHPYNAGRGGPCRERIDLLTAPRGHGGREATARLRRRAVGGLGRRLRLGPLERAGPPSRGRGRPAIWPGGSHELIPIVSDLSALRPRTWSVGPSARRTSRPSAISAPSRRGRWPT